MSSERVLLSVLQSDLGTEASYQLGVAVGGVVGAVVGFGVLFWMMRRSKNSMERVAVAPCPECGSTLGKPLKMTWWGGALGPKLLNHVECAECRATFNGKTGRSNRNGIIAYLTVTSLLGLYLGVQLIGFLRQ